MMKGIKMKSYTWWLKQKRRVQKKYTLFLWFYLSPKELKHFPNRILDERSMKKWYCS